LFGPPGVGKTTLAGALAERLRECGHGVELALSYRPSECPPVSRVEGIARSWVPAALRRLARPLVETFAAAGCLAEPPETAVAAELRRLLPPANVVWSLRLRQYMRRLSRIWSGASLAGGIVLFDQGFVQAVYTFALLSRAADPERIALALDAVPEADLIVRLDAPAEILEARLAERRRRQSRLEQLLDRWTGFGSAAVFDDLHELLQLRARPVICVNSADPRSLRDGVKRAEAIVIGIKGKVSAGPSVEEQEGTA
ncbi:MAG: hypothetical protein ACREFQ_07485, partial [Stellaceae bacterium]